MLRKTALYLVIIVITVWIVDVQSYAQSSEECTSYQELSQEECVATFALMEVAGADNVYPCEWDAVVCSDNTITEITLDSYQLTALPIEIGDFRNLQELYLWDNQLKTLPDSIGNLSALTILDLDSNQLETLPNSIGNLSKLAELYLRENMLETLPSEIGMLSNLVELHLWSNQLRSLPEEIANLQNLDIIDLDDNSIVCSNSEQLQSWFEENSVICIDDPTSVHLKNNLKINEQKTSQLYTLIISISIFACVSSQTISTKTHR